MKKRILSGIRATGRLHLGNYLGAIKGMLELQNQPEFEHLYMVADVHTLTTPYDVQELRKNRVEVIKDYLAAGLNPDISILFQQSEVNEHLELAFFLSSVTTIAKMQHLPTFKEKVKQYPEHATLALLNYPALMAADILAYKANLVPVGIDQEPHLEITREIARRMNQEYSTDFPEPTRFATPGGYVPSLTLNGKMSKTVEGSYITLDDTLDEIHKKIRSVPTATASGGEMSPGVQTLFTFLDLLSPKLVPEFKEQFHNGSLRFIELKEAVSNSIFQTLEPIQQKRESLSDEYVQQVCTQGAQKAKSIAFNTLKQVKKQMGLS